MADIARCRKAGGGIPRCLSGGTAESAAGSPREWDGVTWWRLATATIDTGAG